MTRAEQAAETRVALLEAAKRLFATRGYLNTKITDITAEAGRAAGSFYRHFASKEELLTALLEDFEAAADQYANAPEHKGDFTDPEAVRYHVATFWRVYHEHIATLQALRQAALVDEDFARVFREVGRRQASDIRSHLDNVPDLPASPEVGITVLTSLLDGFAQMWPEMPEDEAVEIITRFAYRALNAKDFP